jgi:hypothetical protein
MANIATVDQPRLAVRPRRDRQASAQHVMELSHLAFFHYRFAGNANLTPVSIPRNS